MLDRPCCFRLLLSVMNNEHGDLRVANRPGLALKRGYKEMSIVLNDKLLISEDDHLWNTSVKAIEDSDLRKSRRIVKREGDFTVRDVYSYSFNNSSTYKGCSRYIYIFAWRVRVGFKKEKYKKAYGSS